MEHQSTWHQLEQHFHACTGLAQEQQRTYVRELMRSQPDLATELLLLLNSDSRAEAEGFCEDDPFDPLYTERPPEHGDRNNFERLLHNRQDRLKLSPRHLMVLDTVTRH